MSQSRKSSIATPKAIPAAPVCGAGTDHAKGVVAGARGVAGRESGTAGKVEGGQAASMVVEEWPIYRVKPYPGNPRHNEGAVAGVVKSIR